jgi:hypothetical protein
MAHPATGQVSQIRAAVAVVVVLDQQEAKGLLKTTAVMEASDAVLLSLGPQLHMRVVVAVGVNHRVRQVRRWVEAGPVGPLLVQMQQPTQAVVVAADRKEAVATMAAMAHLGSLLSAIQTHCQPQPAPLAVQQSRPLAGIVFTVGMVAGALLSDGTLC